jgi:hypothetical protein
MARHTVAQFTVYPFKIGEKINIADGPRRGDWEVVAVSKHKVTLKCPISKREFEWARFCYFVESKSDAIWPQPD